MFQVFQERKVKKIKRTQSRCIFPSKTPPKICQTGFCSKFLTALHAVLFISLENAFLKREKVFSSLRIPTRNHFKRKTEGDCQGCLVPCQTCSLEIIRKRVSLFTVLPPNYTKRKARIPLIVSRTLLNFSLNFNFEEKPRKPILRFQTTNRNFSSKMTA